MFNDIPLIELDQGLARPQMASFRKTAFYATWLNGFVSQNSLSSA